MATSPPVEGDSNLCAEDFGVTESFDERRQEEGREEDLLDSSITSALRQPRIKVFLLKLEGELLRFISNTSLQRLKLPPMPPYQRLLVHRVSDYFKLERVVSASPDGVKATVMLIKTPTTTIPPRRFEDWVEKEKQPEGPVKVLLMKRSAQNEGGSFDFPGSHGKNSSPPPDKTLEEREEEYARARARIFADESPPLERQSSDGDVSKGSRFGVVRSITKEDEMYDPAYDRNLYNPAPVYFQPTSTMFGVPSGSPWQNVPSMFAPPPPPISPPPPLSDSYSVPVRLIAPVPVSLPRQVNSRQSYPPAPMSAFPSNIYGGTGSPTAGFGPGPGTVNIGMWAYNPSVPQQQFRPPPGSMQGLPPQMPSPIQPPSQPNAPQPPIQPPGISWNAWDGSSGRP
eukprot:GILJ01002646.1.p1 GENE.GILJ01002646.1~~GILJ01002646.1.p1  ORF type:complete len:415 (+),score=54.12 GILJ01002646.1:53-1246(+)